MLWKGDRNFQSLREYDEKQNIAIRARIIQREATSTPEPEIWIQKHEFRMLPGTSFPMVLTSDQDMWRVQNPQQQNPNSAKSLRSTRDTAQQMRRVEEPNNWRQGITPERPHQYDQPNLIPYEQQVSFKRRMEIFQQMTLPFPRPFL